MTNYQIDHPLITLLEAITIVAVVRLFFAERRTPFPLPQIILGLIVGLFANLAGRVTGAEWLYISQIGLFGLLLAFTMAMTQARLFEQNQKTLNKEPKGGVVFAPSFFDNREVQISWAVGIMAGLILIYGYLENYETKRLAVEQAYTEAVKQETKSRQAREEEDKQQKALLRSFQDTMLAKVEMLGDTNTLLLANQNRIMRKQEQTDNNINQKSKLTRATIRSQVEPKRPPERIKPAKPVIAPIIDNRTWLQRQLGIKPPKGFSSRADTSKRLGPVNEPEPGPTLNFVINQ